MTEERIKEHAENYWQKHIIPNVDKWSGLLQLVNTVAAEAREEGIDEIMRRVSLGRLVLGGRWAVPLKYLENEAERLKEKGK